MKKFLAIGVLALSAAICSQQTASAWVNFQFGGGFNMSFQCGKNPCCDPWKCGPGGPFSSHKRGLLGDPGLYYLPAPEVNEPVVPMPQAAPTSGENQAGLYGYPVAQPVSFPGYFNLPAYNDYNNYYYYPSYWYGR